MKEQMREALEKAAIEWDKESPDDQFASEVFDDGFKRGWLAALSAVQNHIGDSNEMVKPITDTDSAREFLVENLLPKFSDSTFAYYVRNELAGDFAYQLAKYLQAQQPAQEPVGSD